jgi:hypothetical protein
MKLWARSRNLARSDGRSIRLSRREWDRGHSVQFPFNVTNDSDRSIPSNLHTISEQ